MKITILADLYSDGSHDPAVDEVAEALVQGGHKASPMLVPTDMRAVINGLTRRKPDLVWHMITDFDVEGVHVVTAALLDGLGLRYTGGGPGELYIRGNKGLAKKILAYDQLQCPDFAVFRKDASLETGGNLRLPMIVKPMERDASIGIGPEALVRTVPELMDRVRFIHTEVKDSALAEEYIEGREFFVGVLGNRETIAFPPVELDFSGLPEGAPRVFGYKAKWDEESAEYQGTKAIVPELPDDLKARLQKAALDACRALLIRDFARVDLRLTDTGEIFVIEVNSPCDLLNGSEYATGAAAAGIDYTTLINRIVDVAMERYQMPVIPRKKKKATVKK